MPILFFSANLIVKNGPVVFLNCFEGTAWEEYPMSYKIREFSRIIGVEAHNLRYYEERGLPGAARGENGYRNYSVENAYDTNVFLTMQSMGFTVKEAASMLSGVDLSELLSGLERNNQEMRQTIRLLEEKIRWNEQYEEICRILTEEPGLVLEKELEDYWFLQASVNEDVSLAMESAKEIEEWVKYLPVVQCACLAPLEHLHAYPPLYLLGYAVLDSRLKLFSLPVNQKTRRCSLGRSLIWFSLDETDEFRPEKHPQLSEYMETHHLRFSGDILILYSMVSFRGLGFGHVCLAPVSSDAETV